MQLGGFLTFSQSEVRRLHPSDVRVFGESVGVQPAVYNKGKAIVDDGTDEMYIPTPAWNGLRRIMEAHW